MGREDAGEFLRTREIQYNEFRNYQFSNKNFQLENLNRLLDEANLERITHFKMERFHLRDLKEEVLTNITANRETVIQLKRTCE